MSDLFAQGQTANWRKPTGLEKACEECGSVAPCGMGSRFYCVPHAPKDYWPSRRDEEDVI